MANAGSGNHNAPPEQSRRGKQPRPDPVRGGEAERLPAETGGDLPAAGPHASAALVKPEATPGAGALPRASEQRDDDVDAASG
jgi:hypothetical protein